MADASGLPPARVVGVATVRRLEAQRIDSIEPLRSSRIVMWVWSFAIVVSSICNPARTLGRRGRDRRHACPLALTLPGDPGQNVSW